MMLLLLGVVVMVVVMIIFSYIDYDCGDGHYYLCVVTKSVCLHQCLILVRVSTYCCSLKQDHTSVRKTCYS